MNTAQMPIAVKRSPRTHSAFATYVTHIATCLTGNPSVPNTVPTAATLKTMATNFAQANANARGGGPGVAAERAAQRKALEEQLDHLVDNVRGTISAQATDPTAAAAMILSTGLSIKKIRVVNKPALAVKHGSVSGAVLISALAVARTAMYYWSWSLDQKVWSSVPETLTTKTTISGLTPGQIYYFRFQAKTRKGMGDYSDVVKLTVI